MSKLSIKSLFAIALVLSLMTSALVYTYLKKVSVSSTKAGYPVIVAKTDILPKTKITPDMLQEIQIPPEYIQPGAIQDMNTIVGVMSREKIIAGEQITERRLLTAKNSGFVGLIPSDKRAITVAVTEVTGVAGFVKPGDYVDVVVTFDKGDTGEFASNFVLQNILVLASNHDTENGSGEAKDKKEAAKTATVTLAVSPLEEHWLALSDEKGKIRLALRPLSPDVAIVYAETATPVKLAGLQNASGNSTVGKAAALSAPPGHSSLPAQTSPVAPPSQEPPRVKEQAPVYQPGITVIRGTKVDVVPTY